MLFRSKRIMGTAKHYGVNLCTHIWGEVFVEKVVLGVIVEYAGLHPLNYAGAWYVDHPARSRR